DRIRSCVECPNAVCWERFAKLDGVETRGFAIEDHDVGFDGGGVDAETWDAGDFSCQELRVGAIFMKTILGFLKSQKAGARNDARVTHAGTEHFAVDASLVDEFLGADDHRTDRSTEALGEAEHDRV